MGCGIFLKPNNDNAIMMQQKLRVVDIRIETTKIMTLDETPM